MLREGTLFSLSLSGQPEAQHTLGALPADKTTPWALAINLLS
jgi:hypothetical protein